MVRRLLSTRFPPVFEGHRYRKDQQIAATAVILLNQGASSRDSSQDEKGQMVMPTEAATNIVELRHFFVTPGVAAAHTLSGLAIFAGADSVLKTTPLYLLGVIVQNPISVAFILVITAVLAIIPYLTREPRRRWFMLLILPQQGLLLMHFVSAVMSIMAGQYHDGYAPNGGSAFIFADQIWLLMVVVIHTLEYIEVL
jgi:hypothetical protein